MEIECILKLTQCKEELLDSLEFDMISPCLIQHGVITSTEYERFRDLSSNKDKVVAFLELLPTKSLDTFTRFVKSLEEDYDWLAFSLKNTQITPQQVETYKLSQNNNKPFGDNLKPTPGISGIQARPPVSSGSGVVNDCETMSASQSSNSSVCSQDGRDRRMHQERNDRMAIERDMDQRQERERARFEQERRSRMDMDRGGMDMGDRDLGRMDGGERDRDRMDMGERDRCRIEIGERDRGRMDMGERDRGRMDMGERDRARHEMYDRGSGYNRRQDILDRGHAQDRLERLDYLDRGYGYDRPVRGFGQEPLRHELLDRGTALDRMDRFRQDTIHRTLSQESLERLGNAGFRRMGSPIRRGLGSPLHSSSGGFGSPLHSSEFSLKSSESGEDRFESLSQVGDGKRRQEMEGEITEEMIEFVMVNPRIMKRWQNLAHSVGLSHRVEVIKARIRSEGRDHDEHVGEFLREWAEQKPEAATLGGLINLLKDQKFNDTALKLEDGTFRKRRT
eukprot:GFUD01002881.1.p1 GENE.GFUD01002881.1~~GFUD01002881.1.p1  ORF type:complete len:507 (+),score=134.89 GFUD01002881.1:50-1570(+)